LVMVVCLTTISLVSIASVIFLVWWNLDSAGKHSISAQRQSAQANETMKEMISQTALVVKMQMDLTELLLLGRPMPKIEQVPESEKPPETSLRPDELWQSLPDNIQGAMIREAEEEATYPDLWETLQQPSENGHGVYEEDQSSPSPS
jgi:hypothetical protein